MTTIAPRLRRTALYLPASNARAIAKARELPCDVVILDLEDAVDPSAKQAARDAAIGAVRDGGWGSRELVVRVNALSTIWGRDDLAALAEAGPDAILVPKVSSGQEIAAYDAALDGAPPTLRLWAMIETARSIFALPEIAGAAAHSRLAALVAGTNDLALETRWQLSGGREPALAALSLMVAAARANGLAVLDGVYNALDDDAGLTAECAEGRRFGFDGKTLIHPRQIAICRDAFTPSEAAIAHARAIVAAFALPENADSGVIRLDGRMVERLHLADAQHVLLHVGD